MSQKKRARTVTNDVGKHCQTLIDDFFNFVEGNLEEVHIITELRDISTPMPPELQQMRIMLARCKKAWSDYCDFLQLPRECKSLFINRVKNKWLALEKQQQERNSRIPKRKRGEAAKEP